MNPVSVHAYNIIHNYELIEILVIILYKCLSRKFILKYTHGGIFGSCVSKLPTPTGRNSMTFDYTYMQYEITVGQSWKKNWFESPLVLKSLSEV